MTKREYDKGPLIIAGSEDHDQMKAALEEIINASESLLMDARCALVMVNTDIDLNRDMLRQLIENHWNAPTVLKDSMERLEKICGKSIVRG